jgi:hypothetical protein
MPESDIEELTVDELKARLAMLEMLTLSALTAGLAGAAANAPDPVEMGKQLLDGFRNVVAQGLREAEEKGLSKEATASAQARADELLSYALGNLDTWAR